MKMTAHLHRPVAGVGDREAVRGQARVARQRPGGFVNDDFSQGSCAGRGKRYRMGW